MSELYRTSESTATLFAAMSAAQAAMESAKKDAINPHFQSKYADLASVWDAAREPLTKNGLTVIQIPSAVGPVATITTILAHKGGEWISGDLSITSDKNTAQGLGSAITYARRYALAAFLGIAPEDDDGNAASGDRSAQAPKRLNPSQEKIAERKIEELKGKPKMDRSQAFAQMKERLGDKLFGIILKHWNVTDPDQLDGDASKTAYKQMDLAVKLVGAAVHGELLPGITEEIFNALPDDSIVAVERQYLQKLIGLTGEGGAADEFEAIRGKSSTQWEFCSLLQTRINTLGNQLGL